MEKPVPSLRQALNRPYWLPAEVSAFLLLVPGYVAVAQLTSARAHPAPRVSLDSLFSLIPGWLLVYAALYLFLIILPIFVLTERTLIRRAVWCYLSIWSVSLTVFAIYPTEISRPALVPGDGFAAWGLRMLYQADPPHNCFPSLHVAHSFTSALICRKVSHRLGNFALICAALVALSTLYTRQHQIADLITGAALAWLACRLLLPASAIGGDHLSERTTLNLAAVAAAAALLSLFGFWAAWTLEVL